MTPRRRIDRRADIIAAAARLLEAGTRPQDLTMEAVARAARVGKPTLYRHFPDREALMRALADEKLIDLTGAADRREAILHAALRCYSTLGLTGTTMEAVAQEAGVSLATLYRHFPSKDDLLEALLLHFSVLRDAARLASFDEFDGDDRQALYGFILRLLEVAVERAPIIRLVLGSATAHPEAAQEAFRQGPGRIINLLATYFERRAQAGAFRPGNASLRAHALLSACVTFGLVASLPGAFDSVSLEAVAREYTDVFLDGLRKGRQ